jgi:hypothetical protein
VADPQKRIIVDGVDFAGVVQFPRILGAVTASLQPARLVVGLLMVTLLVTAGRIWDQVATPNIAPTGLLGPGWSDQEQAEARTEIRRIVFDSDLVPDRHREGLDPATAPAFDARDVRAWLEEGFRDQQAAPRSPDALPEQIEQEVARFLDVLERLEAARPRGVFEATAAQGVASFQGIMRSVLDLRPGAAFSHLGDLFLRTPATLWRTHTGFTIAYGLLVLLVFTLGGGALARMAACQFAGQQRIRLNDAIDFALDSRLRLVGAPLVPLLYAVLGTAVITVLGLLMTVPWIDVAGSILYGLSLVVGLLLALLIVGYAAGISLFVPAVACENCDAGDAAQRGYAYVASRPLHRLGYAIVGMVGLTLGYLLVSVVAVATLNLTARLFGTFTSHGAVAAAGSFEILDLAGRRAGAVQVQAHDRAAAWIISFWETLIISLVASYVIVYHFAASTRIYLLMRRACDGQDIEEIWQPGLVPGTQAPMPVREPGAASPGGSPQGPGQGVLASAVRQYTAARFGGQQPPGRDEDAGDAPRSSGDGPPVSESHPG